MGELKRCNWCGYFADSEKCFASDVPNLGWMCEYCGDPIFDDSDEQSSAVVHNLFQPSTQQA